MKEEEGRVYVSKGKKESVQFCSKGTSLKREGVFECALVACTMIVLTALAVTLLSSARTNPYGIRFVVLARVLGGSVTYRKRNQWDVGVRM